MPSENKIYYYLKLKDGFYDSEAIKLLESMDNGYLYSNILLKMYLKSLKNKGMLIFNEYIPYNAKMLATITGHNVDIVEKALSVFKELGLIEILDNGAIYMLDIQQYIGSISSEAERKAKYRARIEAEKKQIKNNQENIGGTLSPQCPDIIYITNYMSNYSSISNSDYEYDIEEKEKKKENYISDGFQNFLDMVKEVCPVVYQRYQNKVDNGNLETAREVKRLLDNVLGRTEEFWLESDFEELKEVFTHASQTYIVKPKYAGLDIAWVLNNIEKVKNTPIEQQTSAAPKAEKFDAMACLQELYNKHKAEEDNGTD